MSIDRDKQISVIVPFFNEENFIEESVLRVLKTNLFKKIILVNDNSSDNSAEIAKSLCLNHENIILINLDKQVGKGNAIKIGLDFVSTSHVIIHDADLEYFPSDIPQMFEIAKSNSKTLILGSRTVGNKKRKNRYKFTYYGNKYLTYIFCFLNFYKVTDIASCYWLIETDQLKNLQIQEKGFAIEVEVLSKVLKNNITIIEVPISYEGRLFSEGKKIRIKDGFFIFFKILQYSKLFDFFKFRKVNY